MWRHKEVLRVVQIGVEAILNRIDHTRLQIDHQCSWDVVLIVSLIEEHILPIVSLLSILLQHSLSADSMLHAQLFPELVTD